MKPALRPLGLYIHIPFCRQKCSYCDFYSLAGREDRMDDYTAALRAHLAEAAPFVSGYTVDTVYFGGGTPSCLGEKRLARLLKLIEKKYRLAREPEVTLEANPDSAGDWKALRALRKAGFNRLSLGMQAADDGLLREIGRIHTMGQVRAAVEAARKAGFQNLSLDLIYGLPGQALSQWRESLSAAVDLEPEHLSCYGLKVEEGTPLFARRESADLPDDDAQAEMYLYAVEFLAQYGYRQYEISNFAKPGRESRHNLKYAYERNLEGYIRGVRDHTPMLSESERIPPLERDTEWLMLRARTVQGLDPKEFETRFRRRFTCFLPFLEECRRSGYAVEEAGCWRILILFVTLPVENDLRLVWLLGMLAATALEYVVGAAMERLFQVRYWDYSKHRFNLHGYICLSSSIAWGFFSILLVRFVHPPVGRLLADVPSWVVDPLALALTAAFTVDVVRSVQAALDLREMLVKLTEENEDLRRLARRAEIIAAFAEDDLRRFRERTEVDTLQERIQAGLREAQAARRSRRQERIEAAFRRRTSAKLEALSAIAETLEHCRARLPESDELDELLEKVRTRQAALRERTAKSLRQSLRILRGNPSARTKGGLQEVLDALRRMDEK